MIDIRSGKRNKVDVQMKDEYLISGQISAGLMLSKGLLSLARDPWLMLIQYMPGPLGFKLRQLYYRSRAGSIGTGVVIDPDVVIANAEHFYIDEFSYLGRGTQIYCPEGYVKIGKRCHLIAWILGHGGVEIGDYVGIDGTVLSITDSHQDGHRMCGPMVPLEQRNLKYGKVIIEDDVHVGRNSMIMPGVHIGEGAIVAPYTFVTRDVPAWAIVMGNPARQMGIREKVRFPK